MNPRPALSMPPIAGLSEEAGPRLGASGPGPCPVWASSLLRDEYLLPSVSSEVRIARVQFALKVEGHALRLTRTEDSTSIS